ncbi:MAG: hypothetical protein II825_09725 [Paludibacteraceae bacterium]|nr:hypothetical protein [Paludibacteraceae bacterium]
MHLFSDYIIDAHTRYEAHRLSITYKENEDAFVFGGFFGAALAAVSLVDTDEGNARGLRLYTEDEKKEFFARYDREVLHDDWGYLTAEIDQLHDAYVQLVVADVPLSALCPNVRLLNLALDLMVSYMHRLVVEQYRAHIWDLIPWTGPFAQWLWSASQVERRRQRYLQTDWSDLIEVISMRDHPETEEGPLFVFAGEEAEDIMSRYLEWLNGEYVAMIKAHPGAKITNADRRYILSQETDYGFLADDIAVLSPDDQVSFRQWMREWETFLTSQLCPQEEIHFWTKEVPDELRDKLLDYLRLQERQPAHYQALTSAVYALRQLGYIPYKLGLRSMRQYLSDYLSENYMFKNTSSQFNRAWKEHGRYTLAVREQIAILAQYGIGKFSL